MNFNVNFSTIFAHSNVEAPETAGTIAHGSESAGTIAFGSESAGTIACGGSSSSSCGSSCSFIA